VGGRVAEYGLSGRPQPKAASNRRLAAGGKGEESRKKRAGKKKSRNAEMAETGTRPEKSCKRLSDEEAVREKNVETGMGKKGKEGREDITRT